MPRYKPPVYVTHAVESAREQAWSLRRSFSDFLRRLGELNVEVMTEGITNVTGRFKVRAPAMKDDCETSCIVKFPSKQRQEHCKVGCMDATSLELEVDSHGNVLSGYFPVHGSLYGMAESRLRSMGCHPVMDASAGSWRTIKIWGCDAGKVIALYLDVYRKWEQLKRAGKI